MKRKIILIAVLALWLLFPMIVLLHDAPSLAWFGQGGKREIVTFTGLETPIDIKITTKDAPGNDDFTQFDLGRVDVETLTSPRQYVFCVRSDNPSFDYYTLTLAYTTNIGFSYTLYHAEPDPDGDVTYLEANYRKGEAVAGEFKNPSDTDASVGKKDPADPYYRSSYGTYENVQAYGVPLYWKSTENLEIKRTVGGETQAYQYYVLEVSWEDGKLFNRKETDIIYIMAHSR